MALIRATCDSDSCGDIEIHSRYVTARVNRDRPDICSYNFVCPCCSTTVLKVSKPRVIELLVTAGVKLVFWSDPEERAEINAIDGPELTHDDLLDFHNFLEEGEDWYKELAEMDDRAFKESSKPDDETTETAVKTELSQNPEDHRSDTGKEGYDQELRLMLEGFNSINGNPEFREPEHDPNADGPAGDINNA